MLKVGTKVLLSGEIVDTDDTDAPYLITWTDSDKGSIWDSWVPAGAVFAIDAGLLRDPESDDDREPIGKTESGELVYALDD